MPPAPLPKQKDLRSEQSPRGNDSATNVEPDWAAIADAATD
jgi:hypothetical protein